MRTGSPGHAAAAGKLTGNSGTDFKNIGSNTPIPVTALTSNGAASKALRRGHLRDRQVRSPGPGQVVAVTLLRCAGASGSTCRARASP
jgi:hypothetical protein